MRASSPLDCRNSQGKATLVPQSLRPHLDQALREEAEALQLAARLVASRASHQEFTAVLRRVDELRNKRIAIQRQIEELRRKQGTPG
jgi:hypothetical protein